MFSSLFLFLIKIDKFINNQIKIKTMTKFITKFDTTAEYNSAKSNFDLPHVSLTTDDNIVHYHTIPLVAKLYDYLYEDGSFGKKDATKTAIGVCVIPGGVLPDRKARFMSLKGMTLTSPNEGGSDTYIYWGGYGSDIQSLTNFRTVVTSDTKAEGTNSSGYVPKNDLYLSTPHIPSPIDYFSAYSSTGATSDLDGKANTEKILAVDNAASTAWQTAETIINNDSIATVHPAAQCCWRFNPGSTNQGDWYLPSIGELAFIMPNFDKLNTAISDVGGVQLNGDYYYWSSTEYDELGAWRVVTGRGYVSDSGKGDAYYVRAFLAL